MDDVIDEEKPTTDTPVIHDELLHTSVLYTEAGRQITAHQGIEVALTSMRQMIPGNDPESTTRKKRIEELFEQYANIAARNANNPLYHQGPVLPYERVLKSRDEITGGVARAGTEFCAVLLNLPENQRAIEFFGQKNNVMQLEMI